MISGLSRAVVCFSSDSWWGREPFCREIRGVERARRKGAEPADERKRETREERWKRRRI